MTNQKEEILDLSAILHGASLVEVDPKLDFVHAQRIVDCRDLLGEGIVYDDRRHAILWTDIEGKRFHELHLDYEKPNKLRFITYHLPKMLGSFGLLEEEGNPAAGGDAAPEIPLLCAWEDGFQLYDIGKGKELSDMSEGEVVNPNKGPSRLNDGRTSPDGKHFICGAYYGEVAENYEKVFKVEQRDGKLYHEPIVDKVQVTNSISWSLDGSRMFLADSPTKKIFTYAYNAENGTLSDKRLLIRRSKDEAFVADGSCVDTEGCLWNAVWCTSGEHPGRVERIDPKTGCVVFTVHIPDATSQVSCCCFGGENMDILFITSASIGRDPKKQPHAGALYAAKVPFQGRKESRLKFTY